MAKRTIPQNSSFHDAIGVLAVRLNDAGYTLSASIELGLLKNAVPWTEPNIKDIIVRPIMKALWPEGPSKGPWKNPERPSTTELDTTEIQMVFDVMTRATAEKFGVTVDWPDRYNGGRI